MVDHCRYGVNMTVVKGGRHTSLADGYFTPASHCFPSESVTRVGVGVEGLGEEAGGGGGGGEWKWTGTLRASLSSTFLQTARFSYAVISAQLTTDAVSALRRVWVLITLPASLSGTFPRKDVVNQCLEFGY